MPSDPAFSHDRVKRVGILLVNLGTPDAPTAAAVRRYLAEFLSDPRVVEIPRLVWLPILHGIVLRTRPAKSAEKYAAIWTDAGSPLLAYSQRQQLLLRGYLGERLKALGLPEDYLAVELGMRYGNPDIDGAMDRLRAQGCDHVLVVPLYPQFAASTTATALDVVYDYAKAARRMPGLRAIDCFHDDPGYIGAAAYDADSPGPLTIDPRVYEAHTSTLLTVLREFSRASTALENEAHDFGRLFRDSLIGVRAALQRA